jgi:hypothetical protein
MELDLRARNRHTVDTWAVKRRLAATSCSINGCPVIYFWE